MNSLLSETRKQDKYRVFISENENENENEKHQMIMKIIINSTRKISYQKLHWFLYKTFIRFL